jgi:hypothetical protein
MWRILAAERMQEQVEDCMHKVHRDYKNAETKKKWGVVECD